VFYILILVKKKRLTLRSPDMLAPAKMPVAAGKKIENTEKKLCSVPSLKRYAEPKFSTNTEPGERITIKYQVLHGTNNTTYSLV